MQTPEYTDTMEFRCRKEIMGAIKRGRTIGFIKRNWPFFYKNNEDEVISLFDEVMHEDRGEAVPWESDNQVMDETGTYINLNGTTWRLYAGECINCGQESCAGDCEKENQYEHSDEDGDCPYCGCNRERDGYNTDCVPCMSW